MKPTLESGASDPGAYNNVKMVGQEVYKFAVRSVPQVWGDVWNGAPG